MNAKMNGRRPLWRQSNFCCYLFLVFVEKVVFGNCINSANFKKIEKCCIIVIEYNVYMLV